MIENMFDSLRHRVVDRATDPFGHTEYPLARTLDHRGDPGLFGPDSVSWRVIGDASAFVGGIRALLIQAAHPEVVAGVRITRTTGPIRSVACRAHRRTSRRPPTAPCPRFAVP